MPYSNWYVVARPPDGVTDPLSVAEVVETHLAAPVVTVGAAASVVNVRSPPVVVPTPFVATSWK